MNEEHNMTLRDSWREYADKKDEFEDFGVRINVDRIADWFIAQFDAMLAEDIEKIGNRGRFGDIRFNSALKGDMEILEARRLSIKK